MAVEKVTWELQSTQNHFQEDDDCEWVFENILSPFFRAAGSHCEGILAPGVVNFYTYRDWPNYGKVINIAGPSIDREVFFDYNSNLGRREEDCPNIRFTYNDRVIAVLTPDQTLWATDWVHLTSSRDHIQYIINWLYQEGHIIHIGELPSEDLEYPSEYKVSMGCDPEFELVDLYGEVRFPPDTSVGHLDKTYPHGNIGLDGSGEVIELRPSPGTPEDVVNNIRGLLESFSTEETSSGYRLSPSSDRFPCGGHIHIGVTPEPPKKFYKSLATVLDSFIGHPTKRLNGLYRGGSHCYGKIGDWREQPWGMEYRTAPSTIFRNPEFSRVVLQLAENLTYQFANCRELIYNFPISKEDLITTGGLCEEDAELYLTECKGDAPDCSECLLAAWDIEVKKPKCKISVTFNDDWNVEVREFVKNFLENCEPKKSLNVSLFGLSASRGNVYTFKVRRRGLLKDHPSAGERSFGFSRKFRDGGESREKMTQIMETLIGILGTEKKKPIIPTPGHLAGMRETFPVGTEFSFTYHDIIYGNSILTARLDSRIDPITNSEEYGLWIYQWDRYYGPNTWIGTPTPAIIAGIGLRVL